MWVGITLASLAALIILVLCIPLDVVFHIDIYGRPKFRTRLVWLFGLISKDIAERKRRPKEKREAAKDKPKPGRRGIRGRVIFKILRTKGLLSQFKRLMVKIISRFKIRKLVADFTIGLDNPADTGLLFALIGPATFFINRSSSCQIRVQPSFVDTIFEGYLYGTIKLRPIRLLTPFIRFAFSLATIRAIKTLVLSKWKRKK